MAQQINDGWIKLHRKFLEWEWLDEPNMVWLFIKCLLMANHEDKLWHGISIKRGSFITSYENLTSKKANVSIHMIRVLINKLKLTGELTYQSTNRYSVITINNYDEYQSSGKQEPSQLTSKCQADDKQVATNNNIKNIRIHTDTSKKTENTSNHTSMEYLMNIPEADYVSLGKDISVTGAQIKSKGEDLYNYCLAHGSTYKNYKAFLRNALRRDYPNKDYNFIP